MPPTDLKLFSLAISSDRTEHIAHWNHYLTMQGGAGPRTALSSWRRGIPAAFKNEDEHFSTITGMAEIDIKPG